MKQLLNAEGELTIRVEVLDHCD